jgi:hypothetical protein
VSFCPGLLYQLCQSHCGEQKSASISFAKIQMMA